MDVFKQCSTCLCASVTSSDYSTWFSPLCLKKNKSRVLTSQKLMCPLFIVNEVQDTARFAWMKEVKTTTKSLKHCVSASFSRTIKKEALATVNLDINTTKWKEPSFRQSFPRHNITKTASSRKGWLYSVANIKDYSHSQRKQVARHTHRMTLMD